MDGDGKVGVEPPAWLTAGDFMRRGESSDGMSEIDS